jgi:hypothetical protein
MTEDVFFLGCFQAEQDTLKILRFNYTRLYWTGPCKNTFVFLSL